MKVKDLDQTEAWSGSILGPGRHAVKIVKATEGTSSNQNPQIELEYQSLNSPGTIREWLVVLPTTYGKLKALLDAVGLVPEGGEWDFPTQSLVGRKLAIWVDEETDRQDPTKKRNRVNAHEALDTSDVPADTSGFGAQSASEADLPF
jgi:hypothetical protein